MLNYRESLAGWGKRSLVGSVYMHALCICYTFWSAYIHSYKGGILSNLLGHFVSITDLKITYNDSSTLYRVRQRDNQVTYCTSGDVGLKWHIYHCEQPPSYLRPSNKVQETILVVKFNVGYRVVDVSVLTCLASRVAVALPRPEAPPVTKATTLEMLRNSTVDDMVRSSVRPH